MIVSIIPFNADLLLYAIACH